MCNKNRQLNNRKDTCRHVKPLSDYLDIYIDCKFSLVSSILITDFVKMKLEKQCGKVSQ